MAARDHPGVIVAPPTPWVVPSATTCPAADHVLVGVEGVVGAVGVAGTLARDPLPPPQEIAATPMITTAAPGEYRIATRY